MDAGQDYEFSVSFGKTFATVPTVVLTPDNDAFTVQVKGGGDGISKTGFIGYAKNVTSWTRAFNSIYWIAVV